MPYNIYTVKAMLCLPMPLNLVSYISNLSRKPRPTCTQSRKPEGSMYPNRMCMHALSLKYLKGQYSKANVYAV